MITSATVNTKHLIAIFNGYSSAKKIIKFINSNSESKLDRTFRDHRENEAGIVKPKEIAIRNILDQFLGLCSILELGIYCKEIDMVVVTGMYGQFDFILNNPSIRRYYSGIYRLELTKLFRERMIGEHDHRSKSENCHFFYEEFLSLDKEITRNKDIEEFLDLIDDFPVITDDDTYYWSDIISKENIWKALMGNGADLPDDFLPPIRGLMAFMEFSSHLEEFLTNMPDPEIRWYFYHYYSYWVNNFRSRLNKSLTTFSNILDDDEFKNSINKVGNQLNQTNGLGALVVRKLQHYRDSIDRLFGNRNQSQWALKPVSRSSIGDKGWRSHRVSESSVVQSIDPSSVELAGIFKLIKSSTYRSENIHPLAALRSNIVQAAAAMRKSVRGVIKGLPAGKKKTTPKSRTLTL